MVAVNANSFQVVTYNILAKSLAANTIPWVMTVSPNIQTRIENHAAQSFKEWVGKTLKPEYMAHFHKNFASGDYAAMRGFWGARQCEGPEDIPKELTGLTWVGQDQVSYGEQAIVVTTLRGMAKNSLPPDLYADFFHEVVSTEEQIFAWPGRGPRIFATATQGRPGIVALQEYDCHFSVADYREQGCSETFAEAMAAIGYDGAFFKDPLKGRDPPSGLGLFWQRNVFEPMSSSSDSPPDIAILECNQDALGGALYNADLEEKWHPKKQPADASPVLMPAADRRNAALARLRHKSSGRAVAVCAVHLMTTSRDGSKTNWYPGEVRAGEMVAIKQLLETQLGPDDALLLVGDFNTDAKDVGPVFGASIPCSDSSVLSNVQFDTNFDAETGLLTWEPYPLKEAFADVHSWGEAVGKGNKCTSYNADRVEWIDFVFHGDNLRPIHRSECVTPSGPIPDESHPSDHLPLRATFEFV